MTRSLTFAMLVTIALHLGVSWGRIIAISLTVLFIEFAFLVVAAGWSKKP